MTVKTDGPTNQLRWNVSHFVIEEGCNGMTLAKEVVKLQQLFEVMEINEADGSVVSQSLEWRDVPSHHEP